MHSTTIRRMFGTSAAILFIAGCSGGNSSITPGAHGNAPIQSSFRVPAGYRVVPGPAVVGPLIVPIAHQNRVGFFHPSTSGKILWVADANNDVVVAFDPAIPNPSPIGMITSGIDIPTGLAVDYRGRLYVVNEGNATITEYKLGQTTPSFTITGGLNSPYGIAVDSHRRVFVSNLGNNTMTGYKHGQTSPYETVSGIGPNPVGVAVDHNNNVFVSDDSNNTIYEIPVGTSTAQNTGITQLNGPIGIAFTTGDTLYASNFAVNSVGIYPAGSVTPSGFITNSIVQPTLSGFAKPGTFFQSEQTGPVVGYKRNQTMPFSTISGIGRPLGIASYPRF